MEPKNIERSLKNQDEQIRLIHDAEEKYERDRDINSLITFWEKIWSQGGILFPGSRWTFRLPDLYIKQKRYSDALKIVNLIDNPSYLEKRQAYIKRITALNEKENRKR